MRTSKTNAACFLILSFLGCFFQKEEYVLVMKKTMSYDDDGIPLKTLELVMPEGDTLFISKLRSFQKIEKEDRENEGIPSEAIFSLKTSYAGATTIYFGMKDKDTLTLFEQWIEETGFRSEPEVLKQYIKNKRGWNEMIPDKNNSWLEYRNQNWQPEKGKYFFSEQYVYSYFNEYYVENDPRRSGMFVFYSDPVTGTLLFTSGDSFFDEMTGWILVRPNKDYIVSRSHEHSNNTIDTIQMDDFLNHYSNKYDQDVGRSFKTFFKPIANSFSVFSKGKYCIKTIVAQAYSVDYHGSTVDSTVLHIATTSYDWNTLYFLHKSEAFPEGGFKTNFLSFSVPKNRLITQEKSRVNGKQISYKLECIYAADYHLKIETP